LRRAHLLLLVILGFLLVYSTAEKVSVSASGTGIGILVDGPSQAQVNQIILYKITVVNLGDYWDRNLTVTDKFPNGTSSSWKVPDLAPSQQPGHQYTISAISYRVRPVDVVSQPPPNHVDSNATVTGYAYVSVSNVTILDAVQAEASFPTVIGILAVGGYSVPPELECLQTFIIIYLTVVFAIIASSGYLHFKFKRMK
jgi:uncharacterized repeat protein (TIGR01451 family)